MLDFYESAIKLNISSNNDIGIRGWQACARTLKKVNCDLFQYQKMLVFDHYLNLSFLVKMFGRAGSQKHNT